MFGKFNRAACNTHAAIAISLAPQDLSGKIALTFTNVDGGNYSRRVHLKQATVALAQWPFVFMEVLLCHM